MAKKVSVWMSRASRQKWLSLAVAWVAGIACFWLALLPVHSVDFDLATYGSSEHVGNISYVWLPASAEFSFRDLPRLAPLNMQITALMTRPAGVAPTHLEIDEKRDGVYIPLASFDYSSAQTDPVILNLQIPALPDSRTEWLELRFQSNGFQVKGDARILGVRVISADLTVIKKDLVLSVLQQPYLPALGLLLAGLLTWAWLAGFGWLELSFMAAPIGFMAGALSDELVPLSFWLVLDGLLMIGLAALWYLRGANWLAQGRNWRAFGLLLAGSFSLLFFFLAAPGMPGDLYYLQQWIGSILQWGPADTYPHANKLLYPPGAVYQFYAYGWLTQPFGLQYDELGYKIMMGSVIPLMLGLAWWMGLRSRVDHGALVGGVMLTGFSLSLLFVPAVWVQADGWLFFLMALSLALVVLGKPKLSALAQGYAIIYKPQSWLLLPLYALTYQWKFSWRTVLIGVGLCLVLIVGLGGYGYGFNPTIFSNFWNQPGFIDESSWGGIHTFNLLHLFGYDQLVVPSLGLLADYALVGLIYLAVLARSWWVNRQLVRQTQPDTATRIFYTGAEWFLAAGFILSVFFFIWIRQHERYMYYGLGFAALAALYRRDLYRPVLLLNALFCLNLLYAYLPERRDAVPLNFFLWRQLLHSPLAQNVFSVIGIGLCLWLGWLYFRHPLKIESTEPPVPTELPASQEIVLPVLQPTEISS